MQKKKYYCSTKLSSQRVILEAHSKFLEFKGPQAATDYRAALDEHTRTLTFRTRDMLPSPNEL